MDENLKKKDSEDTRDEKGMMERIVFLKTMVTIVKCNSMLIEDVAKEFYKYGLADVINYLDTNIKPLIIDEFERVLELEEEKLNNLYGHK